MSWRGIERESTYLRLGQLGNGWDLRIRMMWTRGRTAKSIAEEFGLELATVEAIIPKRIKKRRAA